ncbi:hypothetical protein CDAR_366941 [Caerostris darwini]|uniref:C2HC/C3H-type domain-containing protein n=1 Tax=Caerostris darwini TaxID=1538125 RepID=A0AAV4R6C6_9ARAC|nr:hypothetical protein CDAR_366941 [Caerostris darwini]
MRERGTLMARVSALSYMHCRICGNRFKGDEVDIHEKECLKEKEKNLEEAKDKQSSKPSSKQGALKTNGKTKETTKQGKTPEPLTASSLEEQPLPGKKTSTTQEKSSSQEKAKLKEVAYPKVSAETLQEVEKTGKNEIPSQDSLPVNALVKNEPKQAWNANLPRRISGTVKPIQKPKTYRHYPVSCEFCNRKFQPGPLRKHIQKYHPDAHLPPTQRGGRRGVIAPPSSRPEEETKRKTPSGPPRHMKICYICGRMFGTRSIGLHEPKCLEKWKIENDRLPKNKRMPEPIKPEPILAGSSAGEALSGGKGLQNLPDLDAEAEAAYRCHLKNLVPCNYCRKELSIRPRVMVHENACVERHQERGEGRG